MCKNLLTFFSGFSMLKIKKGLAKKVLKCKNVLDKIFSYVPCNDELNKFVYTTALVTFWLEFCD